MVELVAQALDAGVDPRVVLRTSDQLELRVITKAIERVSRWRDQRDENQAIRIANEVWRGFRG